MPNPCQVLSKHALPSMKINLLKIWLNKSWIQDLMFRLHFYKCSIIVLEPLQRGGQAWGDALQKLEPSSAASSRPAAASFASSLCSCVLVSKDNSILSLISLGSIFLSLFSSSAQNIISSASFSCFISLQVNSFCLEVTLFCNSQKIIKWGVECSGSYLQLLHFINFSLPAVLRRFCIPSFSPNIPDYNQIR